MRDGQPGLVGVDQRGGDRDRARPPAQHLARGRLGPGKVAFVRESLRGRLQGERVEAGDEVVVGGQRGGVRRVGEVHRVAYPPQTGAVGVEVARCVRDRTERLHVGHGVLGRRVDSLHAPGRELLERRGAGEQVLAELGGRGRAVAGVAALGAADDQVALEERGVVLERAEQPADVAAALQALGDVLDADGEVVPVLLGARPAAVGLERHLVAEPVEGGAQVLDPGGVGVGGGVEGEALAQLPGQRVGQSARLRQRHGERTGRRTGRRGALGEHGRVEGGVEAAVDQRREPLALGFEHATAVPDREQQLQPVGDGLPQRHRQRHVVGELVLVWRGERGGVQLVELVLAVAHPRVEIGEVGLHGHHLDRLPQPPGRLRRVHGHHRASVRTGAGAGRRTCRAWAGATSRTTPPRTRRRASARGRR